MLVIAKLRYLRIAPRKVRLVADLIRNKTVEEAQRILNFTVKGAAKDILKLLRSAIANAKNNFQLEENNLYVSKIFVDEGPKLKRWRPRSRGQANEIQKKSSHITIILEEIVKKAKAVKSPEKAEGAHFERISGGEVSKAEKKPKFRPHSGMAKQKTEKTTQKIFRRKSF